MHGKRRSGREVYARLNGSLSRDAEIMPLQVRPRYPLFHLLRPALLSTILLPAINKIAPICLAFMSTSYKS